MTTTKTMTTTLTLGDIVMLCWEISGSPLAQKGLLDQPISIAVKFRLTKLLNSIQRYREYADKERNEYMKKYGTLTPDGKNYQVDGNSEHYEQFMKDVTELVNIPQQIEHDIFRPEDFDFPASERYPVFMKILASCQQD